MGRIRPGSSRPLAVLLGVCLAALLGAYLGRSQDDVRLPENPLAGRLVFEQKGCITCHAIQGQGGHIGPDLGEKGFSGGFLELAAVMWNHAPQMLRRMRELGLPFPRMARQEMADLTGYLYYLRYLGEPGDLYRGRLLVEEKGCLNCHSIQGKGGRLAPPFDRLAEYAAPLYLAQSLWNHGPVMDAEIRKKGLPRPVFGKRDIVDLSAYIRSAAASGVRSKVYMTPGNPRRGKELVRSKGCLTCHSVNGVGGSLGPDFARLRWDFSVTEIAGLMWNHGSEMALRMKQKKIQWPRFKDGEMADLIAYLYFLGFQDLPGDAARGRKILETKGCFSCHRPGAGAAAGAPALSRVTNVASVADMIRIMWNHTPVMEKKVTEKVLNWPELTREDMRHLYAYLQRSREAREK